MTTIDDAFDLLNLPAFKNELAQIGARAALASLTLEPAVGWSYRTERVVRNVTAVGRQIFDSHNAENAERRQSSALTVAKAWEDLAALEQHLYRSTALLNSSMFYELAGYQANAVCLARLATDKSRWSTDPAFDGLISAFLQRLFVRVTNLRTRLTQLPEAADLLTDDDIERHASYAVTAIALSEASTFFLSGDHSHVETATEMLDIAKKGLAGSGDIVGFNAIAGLEHVLPRMVERSIWRELGDASESNRWKRYLKVLARGLGPDILESRSISELWPSQSAAIGGGLLNDQSSLAVRMPTSAGKTRVAELAIVHSLVTNPGSKCVYIAPFRALVSEVEESFGALFHDLGYAASTIPGGFDQDEMGDNLAATDDVLILTPEKLDLLFRISSELLDQVLLIVIDEGHIVSDRQRGPKFELLISRLRRRIPLARFLMMSAVVPDETLSDFAEWLGGDAGRSASTDWRPSILRLGRLDWNGKTGTLRYAADEVVEGGLEFIPNLIRQTEFPHVAPETGRVRRPKFPATGNKSEVAAELAYRYAPLGPLLVFAMQTNWSESIAAALLRRIELAELVDEPIDPVFSLRNESRALAVASEWLGDEHHVTQLLRRGIAFHHARLPDAVRNAIEQEFRERHLGVLVATSTLAQGVNLPVRTAIIHSCRSREADGSTRVLSSREYWNIAGRAGRAGAETEGTVIHITTTPYDVIDFNKYAADRQNVERVESALHHMLRDLVGERISSEEAASRLDADILALLVEENEVALASESLAETFSSSLFQIQALQTQTPIDRLIDVMTSMARRIQTDIPDVESRRTFSSTGLSSRSCQTIAVHVSSNQPIVRRLLSEADLGDRDEILDVLLAGLSEVREMEPNAALQVDTRAVLSLWLDGEQVRTIAEVMGVEDAQDATEFIEDAFSYRLPWGASAYLRIASETEDIPITSKVTANIAGMIKYGVPSPEAAWAMSAGVASRRAAIAVANDYLTTSREHTVTQFRRWLGQLDLETVADRLKLAGAELESAARAILRSQPNEYLSALDRGDQLLPMTTVCRPIRSAIDSGLVSEIDLGHQLEVRRDLDSRLNRNALYLAVGRRRLGYLRLDAARALALEIDAGVKAVATVTGSDDNDPLVREFTVVIRNES